MRRPITVAIALAAAFALAGPAAASQLIDRNATGVRLVANARGEALLTYRAHGRVQRVLAWGAVDARFPTSGKPQVRFNKDYAGGWGKLHDGCHLQTHGNWHEKRTNYSCR